MYTEEEAKVRICPAINASMQMCVASGCMAWRWEIARDSRMVDGDVVYVRIGYCGLAGPIVKRSQPLKDAVQYQT